MLTLTDEAIHVDHPTHPDDAPDANAVTTPDVSAVPEAIRRRPATDSEARFERFCVEEHAAMANALGWALGNHDLGREATDEAFARAYERWSSVAAMDNPAGWVYRVGLNWGRRRIWRRNKERQLLSSVDLDEQIVSAGDGTGIDHDLAEALATLPLKFRAVIVLRHLLGYSERDTAEALGISPGTAKSRMSRGLLRLRAELEKGNHDTENAHSGSGPNDPAAGGAVRPTIEENGRG